MTGCMLHLGHTDTHFESIERCTAPSPLENRFPDTAWCANSLHKSIRYEALGNYVAVPFLSHQRGSTSGM